SGSPAPSPSSVPRLPAPPRRSATAQHQRRPAISSCESSSSAPCRVSGQVFEVPVVFVADELHQIRSEDKPDFLGQAPRAGISLGIVDRDPNLHVAEILP